MYGGANTINLMSKIYIFFVVFLVLFSTSYSKTNTITYTCKGLSNFEIIGAPGVKEEMKEVTYDFINGALQDLNNIECNWWWNYWIIFKSYQLGPVLQPFKTR